MAENQGNGQQGSSFDFQSLLGSLWDRNNNGNYEAQIAQYLRVIATTMTHNPDAFMPDGRTARQSQSNYAESKWKTGRDSLSDSRGLSRSTGDPLKDFTNEFKKSLLDGAFGGDFKQNIRNAMNTFTKEFGVDLRKLPQDMGKQLGNQVGKAIRNSKTGKYFEGKITEWGNSLLGAIFDRGGANGQAAKQGIQKVVGEVFKNSGSSAGGGTYLSKLVGQGGGSGIANVAQKGLANIGMGAGAGAGGTSSAALQGLMSGAKFAGPYALLIVGIAYTIIKVLGPALKGLAELAKSVGKSWSREEDLRAKRVKNAQERLERDVQELARKPFEILQQAAEKWEQTWDSNLRQIGQTQGYDKESVYALYEGYARRLREDDLASAINATDIVDKLASVLSSGLSGRAAEEFAYQATKLGAAIPTQDFFQYADTYASIAANAIAQGKDQETALSLANAQLEQFASNLLYAGRELAGGFSTGLQNSSELFKSATQIAQAAKSSNAAGISGTLTSVSAIIGAVAPDLASSLVSNVVDAALGGNSSTIVALRSLAGINASNTEFLQALATNPKQVFSNLFSQLANLQNMSPDNYMEVAEGLAEVFGIDKAAFARVDFNYLANAINAMQVSYDSLDQNMALLQSGQTTTSAEQLKAQEINRIILDEGLAYVIDSEAGRMIQEHMWQEQIANELESTTYSVEIQGAALTFLEGIRKTINTLLNFLNPIGFVTKGISNMTQSVAEAVGNDDDIREILMLGSVGGNAQSFYNLTTRGKNLELTKSLVEMMGGTKGNAYMNGLSNFTHVAGNAYSNWLQGSLTGIITPTADEFNMMYDSMTTYKGGRGGGRRVAVSSQYAWGMVGKSIADAIQSTSINTNTLGAIIKSTGSSTEFAQKASNERMQNMINSIQDAVKKDENGNTKSYEQWVGTAKNFGISDYSAALEAYGHTEEEIKAYFEQAEAQQGAIIEQERKNDEEAFRNETRAYWGFTSSGAGIFNNAMWTPFFGEGEKYDTTMTAVQDSLSIIQQRIGYAKEYAVTDWLEIISNQIGDVTTDSTVLGVLGNLDHNFSSTFVTEKFQACLTAWYNYAQSVKDYTGSLTGAWDDLRQAEDNDKKQASLALAKALEAFTAGQIEELDPQLQTNVLLGQIVVILQSIMQQNNSVAGGLSLIDTISALGTGMTKK